MVGRSVVSGGIAALVAVPGLLALVAWVFYLIGNGLVPGTLALGTLPLLLLTAPWWVRSAWGHRFAALVAFVDLLFLAYRYVGTETGGPIRYVVDGSDGGTPPLLSAVIREDESAAAGIVLSAALGGLYEGELPSVRSAAPAKYRDLDTLRHGSPGVNAVLLSSTPERVKGLASWPPGTGPVPTIVFLHGYGGLLTTYVSSLRESPELDGWGIIAPALGFSGAWWTTEGRAVIARTLDMLPARADRGRVVLIGLSNGAVGVTAVAADPAIARRLRAAVAIEGLAGAERFGVPRVPLLAVAATDDLRFSFPYVQKAVASLQAAGADVTLVPIPGDHMAFFTHTGAVTEAVVRHLEAHP